jgi:predicted nucleic acid-binding protein
MRRALVLDGSVALHWLFHDGPIARIDAIMDKIAQGWTIEVPAIWPYEIVNGMIIGQRRGRINAAEAAVFLSLLKELPITIHGVPSDLDTADLLAAQQSALHWGLTAYDAAYLQLAMTLKIPLATFDQQLAKAAAAAGVTLS